MYLCIRYYAGCHSEQSEESRHKRERQHVDPSIPQDDIEYIDKIKGPDRIQRPRPVQTRQILKYLAAVVNNYRQEEQAMSSSQRTC